MAEICRYRGYEIVPRRVWSQWCVSVSLTRPDPPILSRSTLRTLMPRRDEAPANWEDLGWCRLWGGFSFKGLLLSGIVLDLGVASLMVGYSRFFPMTG
jgi:hypothetical protein